MGNGSTVRDSSFNVPQDGVLRVDGLASILEFGVLVRVWVAHYCGLSFRL